MIRLLPAIVEIVVLVFCLIDAIMADKVRIRRLPRWAWIALIILIPVVGGIAWLIGGRPLNVERRGGRRAPVGEGGPAPRPKPRPMAPDDDPAFLASLKGQAADQERQRKREEDLRRREDELLRREDELRNPSEAGSDAEPEPEPDER